MSLFVLVTENKQERLKISPRSFSRWAATRPHLLVQIHSSSAH